LSFQVQAAVQRLGLNQWLTGLNHIEDISWDFNGKVGQESAVENGNAFPIHGMAVADSRNGAV
jgi:hypothetical protein